MSEHWPPQSGLDNDRSQVSEGFDFTHHESQSGLPAQMSSMNQHVYNPQAPGPISSHIMPLELQQFYGDARADQPQIDSTHQSQYPSQVFTDQPQYPSSPSSQRTRPSGARKATSKTPTSPSHMNDNPQRFSPYPSGSPKSQSRPTARSGTPTVSSGPNLPSPNRQRGSTRSPSARPTTMSPHPPSALAQPLYGSGLAIPIQQGAGPRPQLHRNTKSSDLALQAHIQNLSDRVYRELLARHTTQYGVRLQDLHSDVLATLKNRAFATAHQMVHQASIQRNAGSPQPPSQLQQHHQMLPPPVPRPSPLLYHAPRFDGQQSPEPRSPDRADSRPEEGRSQSPATSGHSTRVAATAHGEGLPSLTPSGPDHEDSAPPPIESDPSTTILPTNRLSLLKSQVIMTIVTANNAYANRASDFNRFQRHYPHLQQNVMNSTYALIAGPAGLDLITPQIWTAPDEHLLRLVHLVSARLKHVLPAVQGSIGNLLGNIQDPELRWTATRRSLEMFYNSFSSLKACLKTRDDRRGDGQRTFVDALGLDRAYVWRALTPESDDELDGSLAEEQAAHQAQTVASQVASRTEWEALQAQRVQAAYQAIRHEGA